MKKSKIALLLAFTSIFLAAGDAQAVTYTYTANPDYPSGKIEAVSLPGHGILCQSFTPTTTTLSNYIYAMVDGYKRDATKFVMNLHQRAPIENGLDMPGDLIGEYRATTIGAKPNGFTNSLEMTKFTNSSVSEVNVETNKKYVICIRSSETYDQDNDGDIVWYSDPNGSYSGGLAHSMGLPIAEVVPGQPSLTYDFGFAIYNKVAQADAPAPANNNTNTSASQATTSTSTPAATAQQPTGITAGSGAAPATPTASIKSPTELVAADVPADQGGAVKLDWKASASTDITGYKIFRSIEEKKSFGEVAKTTDKTILSYTDNTAAIGQKYYYIVRAYKDTKESASSKTVNATSVDNMPPAAPKNFTYAKSALDFVFAWDKNTETDLTGYSLQIADGSGKLLKTIEIVKDANSYKLIVGNHPELKAAANYQFALIAKDANGNSSEKTAAEEKSQKDVEAVSNSESKKRNPLIWYVSSIAAVLLVAGGGLYWFKFKKNKLSPME